VQGLAHESRPPGGAPPNNSRTARQDAWFNADVTSIQRQVPYPLLPVWVEQAAIPGRTELPIPDPNLALDDGPHLGYTIQWWGFAAILLAGYVVVMTQEPGKTRLQPLRARSAERGARNKATDDVSG
jgi:surfeit locus 1 family protein